MSGRTLYLLRHAKSSWDEPTMRDFDRPLNKRGDREARWAAAVLKREGYFPASVICSPARRTRETLEALHDSLSPEAAIVFESRVYEATSRQLLGLLHEQPAESSSVLMIGHNPGLEDLARGLCGAGDRDALRRLNRKYPPAGLAVIELTGDWSDLDMGSGRLRAFHTPDE